MTHVETLNLIRGFDFYLAVMAFFGLVRRYRVYRDTVLLVVSAPGRWPRLTARMTAHRGLLLNARMLRPAVLAVTLMGGQMVASRVVFPRAAIRVMDLVDPWWLVVPFLAALGPMLAMDFYFLWRVGKFDRTETEQYLDTAEKWTGTWQARAVRIATFGRIDPNRMVEDELKKGLGTISDTVNWSLWWVSAQVALRVAFGVTVWLLWAARE